MNKDYTKILCNILSQIGTTDHIRPGDIPNIDLYMDQVTSFMDEHLKNSKRYEDDKILTKTMINNYAKNKLLPPPVKKRYSKEHMLVLIFIYYFKGFLPLNDISSILKPINERFFNSDKEFGIEDIYSEVYELGKEQIGKICRDIMESYHAAANSQPTCPEEDQEFLQLFSFICMLSFDIYIKKEVIEKMIDSLPDL
ncbi:MAG: DUF1836 domain-containing protein [Candidatus Choladocola sp.]|nr:DUF1836 domain-containing protein [Candidatus Choladocola sp.]